MSICRCDICDRPVDTDENVEGSYDDVSGIYACESCCDRWEETVTGVHPTSRLQRLHDEWNRQAQEILQTLAEGRERSLEGERRMSEITREAIQACDQLLEKISG
jgi:hypothetical protein